MPTRHLTGGAVHRVTLPLQALEKALGQRVVLALKDLRVLEGTLSGFDEHMNLVLTDAEERLQSAAKKLGTVVLRGNNVVSIAPK
jgi:small nuclear ribonucleoprotein